MTSLESLPESLQTVRWKELFVIELAIDAVHHVGNSGVVGVVGGGRFSGSRLSGRVLPGGSDWQRVMPDGTTRLDCRLVLETAAGDLIAMTYQGVRTGPADVLARLAKGLDVSADEYYLRVNPMFSTESTTFEWLNRMIAIGAGQRLPGGPVYSVFEIL